MQELLRSAANLPNALVRPLPVFSQPLEDALHVLPSGIGNGIAVLIREVNGIHHFPVDIQLQLLVSGISNAYWTGVFVPGEIVQRHLVKFLPAIHSIHYLQGPALRVVTESS